MTTEPRAATEMELRVAKAIEAAEDQWLRQKCDANQGVAEEPDAPIYITVARAAIQAMREPTADMVEIGHNTPINHSWGKRGEFLVGADVIWEVMVDAASPPSKDAS